MAFPQLQNISATDLHLSVTQALPGAGANVTTGVLDLQAVAPNSDAWQLGLLSVLFPNLPENVGTGITVALQAAPPSLVAGSASIAPNQSVPGAFVTPQCAQTITLVGVAGTGTFATKVYFTLALDPNGSTYQFYQFLITTPAGTNATGEPIVIAWEPRV